MDWGNYVDAALDRYSERAFLVSKYVREQKTAKDLLQEHYSKRIPLTALANMKRTCPRKLGNGAWLIIRAFVSSERPATTHLPGGVWSTICDFGGVQKNWDLSKHITVRKTVFDSTRLKLYESRLRLSKLVQRIDGMTMVNIGGALPVGGDNKPKEKNTAFHDLSKKLERERKVKGTHDYHTEYAKALSKKKAEVARKYGPNIGYPVMENSKVREAFWAGRWTPRFSEELKRKEGENDQTRREKYEKMREVLATKQTELQERRSGKVAMKEEPKGQKRKAPCTEIAKTPKWTPVVKVNLRLSSKMQKEVAKIFGR